MHGSLSALEHFVAVSSPHSPDVLAALRAATAQRHATLDSSMPLAKPHPSIADYRDHLLLLKAWLGPIESWLAGFADGPQDPRTLTPLRRLPLIESDLAHDAIAGLSKRTNDARPRALPRAHGDNPAYRWGVCYVVEGSQLGGAVLYKRLHAQLAPHPLRYLAGNGEPVGPRWHRFVQGLQQDVMEDAAVLSACEGGRHAFDSLLELLPHSSRDAGGVFTDHA
jgi:heme oxygenase